LVEGWLLLRLEPHSPAERIFIGHVKVQSDSDSLIGLASTPRFNMPVKIGPGLNIRTRMHLTMSWCSFNLDESKDAGDILSGKGGDSTASLSKRKEEA